MEITSFVDYYEILNVRPNAGSDAIERKFRNLARRYHPDNQATGDRSRFDQIVEAHNTLRDPGKRARYDSAYPYPIEDAGDGEAAGDGEQGHEADGTGDHGNGTAHAGGDEAGGVGIDRDVDIQNKILTILYIRRRSNVREPGIGDAELEHVTGCPAEHLDFHLWYMKEKGWIRRSDDGLLAITIDGVDRATFVHQGDAVRKLITDQT